MPRQSKPLPPIPDGLTLEDLDAYARERTNAKRRAKYAADPERVKRQRVQAYTNFLQRNGYMILPMLPPPPWTQSQAREYLKLVLSETAKQRAALADLVREVSQE